MSAIADRVLDLAVTIQQIPAPTFAEARRIDFVHACFQAEGLAQIEVDELGNVYACLPGSGSVPPVVVTAHMDTVFPPSVDLHLTRGPDKISGPGIGDNALGVAGLFGLSWMLRQGETLPGDVWLVANVGEEGLGNLRGMNAVVDRFAGTPRAYVILEGMSLGQVYHRGLSVQRYRITARTPGGHSWVNFGRPSAIHELARLISSLEAIPLPEKPRTTWNVGIFTGGTSVNTIAAEASLELDLRSEDAHTLAELSAKVESLVQAFNHPGSDYVTFTAEVIGRRPVGEIPVDHPLVSLAMACLQAQKITPSPWIGSTDANVPLSRGFPAICTGLTTGGNAHTINEYINIRPLSQGLAHLEALVRGIFAG